MRRLGSDSTVISLAGAGEELVEERVDAAAAGRRGERHRRVSSTVPERTGVIVAQHHRAVALPIDHLAALGRLREFVDGDAVGGDHRILQIADADVADQQRDGQVDPLADIDPAFRRRDHDEPLRLSAPAGAPWRRWAAAAAVTWIGTAFGLVVLTLHVDRERPELELTARSGTTR